MLDEVTKAARQAADLAQQMLAYSGTGRFVIQPCLPTRLVQKMGVILSNINDGVVDRWLRRHP